MPNTPRMWRLTNLQADLPTLPREAEVWGDRSCRVAGSRSGPRSCQVLETLPKNKLCSLCGLRFPAYAHHMWNARPSHDGAQRHGSTVGWQMWALSLVVTPDPWTPDRLPLAPRTLVFTGYNFSSATLRQRNVRLRIGSETPLHPAEHFCFWLTTKNLQENEGDLPGV